MIQDLENALAYVTRKTPLNPYLQTECGLGTALSTLRSASRSASTSIVDTLNSATGRSGTGNLLFDGIMNGQRKTELTWNLLSLFCLVCFGRIEHSLLMVMKMKTLAICYQFQ